MAKLKKYVLPIFIEGAPEDVCSTKVAAAIQKLIEVGQADAQASLDDPDIDADEQTELAASLNLKVGGGPVVL